MGELIPLLLCFLEAMLSYVTRSNNFSKFGLFSVIVTILAIFIWLSSYYINCYEWSKYLNIDMFPASNPVTDIEIHRIKDKIFYSQLRCQLSYYCFIFFGLVSIVFLLSVALRLV